MAPRKPPNPKAPKVRPKSQAAYLCSPSPPLATIQPPSRAHSTAYHYPLLASDKGASGALLSWFESIEEARSMPWRKRWIDPGKFDGEKEELDAVLARRAYEVWVSEIMLQQTRVSTVIPYFNTWIGKWPTVHDLAAASPDDVLSAWKGLGYYSRATRLHEGAKAMIAKNPTGCPIPSTAEALMEFPGIGRYTAGAVSSIAFGVPEPVLDGNVVRVLSRQLGIYADGKDKKTTDVLWEVAELLVKSVAAHPEVEKSKVPGQWNQAVMELGSTICTPRPKCDECPIQQTCRAYAEGQLLAQKQKDVPVVPDIEDTCGLCEQLDTEDLVTAPEADEEEESGGEKPSKKRKPTSVAKPSNKISNYFAVKTPKPKSSPTDSEECRDVEESDAASASRSKKRKAAATQTPKSVITYCSLFPKRMPKKKAAEEECVVCIIELEQPGAPSKYLIEQRPAKGLLASLWQFPQCTIPSENNTAATRKSLAKQFLSAMNLDGSFDIGEAAHVAELGSLLHVFSHLRLMMHVHLFRLELDKSAKASASCGFISGTPARKWVDLDAMERETLSTGMRRCWALVSDQ